MGLCASANSAHIDAGVMTLQQVPLFAHLDEPELQLLARAFRVVPVEEGEVIFQEGDEGDSYFIMSQGRVRVTALGKDGEPSFLAEWVAPHAFGEIALLRNSSKRTATVVAEEPGSLMVLTNKRWQRLRAQPWMEEVRTRMSDVANHRMALFLREISFLSLIEEAKLEVLGSLFSYERAAAGDVVCRQGDTADTFYVISRGSVRVTTTGPNGAETHIADLSEGQYFGEMALLANTPRTANVTARDTCMLLCLSRDSFTNFLKMVPDAKRHLEVMMRQRAAGSLKTVNCPLFQSMAEPQLKLLANLCESVTVEAGHVFFRQGEAANAFYVITLGTAEVRHEPSLTTAAPPDAGGSGGGGAGEDEGKRESHGGRPGRKSATFKLQSLPNPLARLLRSGQSTHTASLGVGDYFGEAALLFNIPRTATLTATTDCTVLRFSCSQFHHIFARNATAMAEFILRLDPGALSLELTLLHVKAREFFRQHLESEFSSEALNFFLAAQRAADDHHASAEETLQCVRDLTDTYIRASAPSQVNIRARCRCEVERVVDSTTMVTQSPPSAWADRVLLNARREVFKLMERDGFPRFKQGPAFGELLVAGRAYCLRLGALPETDAETPPSAQPHVRRASTGSTPPRLPKVLLMPELAALPNEALGVRAPEPSGPHHHLSSRSAHVNKSTAAEAAVLTTTIANTPLVERARKAAQAALGLDSQQLQQQKAAPAPRKAATSAARSAPVRDGSGRGQARPTTEQRARGADSGRAGHLPFSSFRRHRSQRRAQAARNAAAQGQAGQVEQPRPKVEHHEVVQV